MGQLAEAGIVSDLQRNKLGVTRASGPKVAALWAVFRPVTGRHPAKTPSPRSGLDKPKEGIWERPGTQSTRLDKLGVTGSSPIPPTHEALQTRSPANAGLSSSLGGTGTRHVAYTWPNAHSPQREPSDCGLMAERGRGVRSWPFAGVMSRSEREIVVLRRAPMGRHLALAQLEKPPEPTRAVLACCDHRARRGGGPPSRLRSSRLHPRVRGRKSLEERLHRRLPEPQHVRSQPDPLQIASAISTQHRLRREAQVIRHLARRQQAIVHGRPRFPTSDARAER